MTANCTELKPDFYSEFVEKYRRMIFDEKELCFTWKDLAPWHLYHFAVKQSRFGRSLIATRDLAKGERIACLPAIFVTHKVEKIAIEFDGQLHEVDLEEHLYDLISAGQGLRQFSHLSTFLDHVCWPACNAVCDGHIWRDGTLSYTLSALRNISEGEYVSVDYATIEYTAVGAAQLDCACGSAGCRKRYTGFTGLSPTQQSEFIEQGLLEAPVAYQIWKTLDVEGAQKFARLYKAGRPQGDWGLFVDLCQQ